MPDTSPKSTALLSIICALFLLSFLPSCTRSSLLSSCCCAVPTHYCTHPHPIAAMDDYLDVCRPSNLLYAEGRSCTCTDTNPVDTTPSASTTRSFKDGRYEIQIHHKLGFGGCSTSTMWLACEG